MTKDISSKSKAPRLPDQLPEVTTPAIVEDKVREILEYLKTQTK